MHVRTYSTLLFSILAAATVYFGASLADRPRYERGDLFDYYIPVADNIGRSLARGEFPFWNPLGGCGFDQIGGSQAALFYPFTYINAILPVDLALTSLVLIHLVWFIWGFQKWLRQLGVQPVPALSGAVVAAFGIIAEAWWPPMFYTLAWTPWILWNIGRKGGWHWITFSGAGLIALQLLAGFPQYFYYSIAGAGLYALVKSIREMTIRPTALLAGGAVFGVGLAASQLIVTSEYLKQCWRSSGPLAPEVVHYYDDDGYRDDSALRVKTTIKHVIRTAFNSLDNQRPNNPRSLSSRSEFGYLGFFVPLAALLGFASSRRWEVVFFTVVGLGSIYLSLGYIGGPLPIYKGLSLVTPMFGAFRTPDRIQFWTVMACGVLVAFGLNRLASPKAVPRRILLTVTTVGLLMILVRLVVLVRSQQENPPASLLSWFILMAGAVSLMALTLRMRGNQTSRFGSVAVGVVCILLLTDCVISGRYVTRWQEYPGKFYSSFHDSHDESEVFLNRSEVAKLTSELGPERAYLAAPYRPVAPGSALPPFRSLPFYEPMMAQRHYELFGALTDPGNSRPSFTAFIYWNIPINPHQRWLDWCSVKQLVSPDPLEDPETEGWARKGESETGAVIYENLRAVPRASLFAEPRLGNRNEALAELMSPVPLAPTEGPILEVAPSSEWLQASNLAGAHGTGSGNNIVWIDDRPNRIELEVRSERPMILLLSDSWFPGWECHIDGMITPILRANFIHRAVEIMPGIRRVVFQYEPVGIRLGISISLGTLGFLMAACGAIEVHGLKKRRWASVLSAA